MNKSLIIGKVQKDCVKIGRGFVTSPGGSGLYAAIAASHFSRPVLMSRSGSDYEDGTLRLLRKKGIDISHIEHAAAKTPVWKAEYGTDGRAQTLEYDIDQTVWSIRDIPARLKRIKFAYIGEQDPEDQLKLVEAFKGKFVLVDTKPSWVETGADIIRTILHQGAGFMMNKEEASLLMGRNADLSALRRLECSFFLMNLGAKGSLMKHGNVIFRIANPVKTNIIDLTGAGDSFGGAFIGALASGFGFKNAFLAGSAMSSIVIEGTGPDRALKATLREILVRMRMVKCGLARVD